MKIAVSRSVRAGVEASVTSSKAAGVCYIKKAKISTKNLTDQGPSARTCSARVNVHMRGERAGSAVTHLVKCFSQTGHICGGPPRLRVWTKVGGAPRD